MAILRAEFWTTFSFWRCVLAAVSKMMDEYSRMGRIKDL